jgi:peptidoglycan/LPS O-acetylase OafA/YrhL
MRGRADEDAARRNFFIRRYFRIAPLFYLAMLAYILGYGFGPRAGAPYGTNGWHILWTALFLNGWHPEMINSIIPVGWSIAVEMTFYLLAPFLFARLKNIRQTLLLVLGTVVLMKVLQELLLPPLATLYPGQDYFIRLYFYLWFFAQLPVFIIGIMVYQIFLKTTENPDRSLGTVLLLASFFLFISFLNVSTYANLLPVHILYGLAFGIFTLALAHNPVRLLVNPLTVWIGKLSYSVYLIHYGIAVILLNLIGENIPAGDLNYFLVFLLLTGITLPISWLTYTFVERPGIRLGKRLIQYLDRRSAGQAGEAESI